MRTHWRRGLSATVWLSVVLAGSILAFGAAAANAGPSLVGRWVTVMRDTDPGYNSRMEIWYGADGQFQSRVQVPPDPHTGNGEGTLVSSGRWRLTAPNAVEENTLEAKACPAQAINCVPLPNFIGRATSTFQFDGPDRVIVGGGKGVLYRVRP